MKSLLFSLGLIVAFSGSGAAQLSGAVFTTNKKGLLVNGNIYESRKEVYLNGGPQPNAPSTAAGLPDGDYYFQVTDPAGKVLLSSAHHAKFALESIEERRVRVKNGVMTQYLGSTHVVSTGKAPGSISVALFPFLATPNPGGEYKAWMTPVGAYQAGLGTFGFMSNTSKTDNFKVRPSKRSMGIVGFKFYDANANGIFDPSEVVIPGWRIEMTPPVPALVTYTSATGQYSFLAPSNSGSYTISEVAPFGFFPASNWINTTPLSQPVVVGSTKDGDIQGPIFGNVCLGRYGGGHTLGFWHNNNGEAKMITCGMAGLLAELRLLNLRNADGSNFDPYTFAELSAWLVGANAVNMAHMLSVQMTAMYLNVATGFVKGSDPIYAAGNTTNTNNFATVSQLLAEANIELGHHAFAMAEDTWRTYQGALKDALDRGNNNLNFVQTGPSSFVSPY